MRYMGASRKASYDAPCKTPIQRLNRPVFAPRTPDSCSFLEDERKRKDNSKRFWLGLAPQSLLKTTAIMYKNTWITARHIQGDNSIKPT